MKDFETEISISSTTHSLSLLRQLVDSVSWDGFKDDGVSKRRCLHLLVEGVNNAIFHAHGGDENKNIGIKIGLEDHAVNIEIKDRGPGFDLDSISEPPLDSDHGRGLLIIRGLADSVSYSNNTLKMRLYEK